ncbi:MAG: LuxR C-terminal-related transcriptional regulator [Dehalococcoidia bacterium]
MVALESTGNGTVHVLIVERDTFSRFGLEQILGNALGASVTAAVETVTQAEQIAASMRVDVVLLGSDVIDMDGLDGLRRLLVRFPQARVIVLGSEDDPVVATMTIRGGADGYLPRSTSPEGLVRSLQAAKRGEVAIPRALMPHIVNALRTRSSAHGGDDVYERLSQREREVLNEMTRGRSNAEIAQRLNLKESTVKTHVSSILRKTGSRSRFALSALAQ